MITKKLLALVFVTALFVLAPFASQAALLTSDLSIGSRGSEVTQLQLMLFQFGYSTDAPTGTYSQKTADAVKALQKKYGIEQTGTVGAKTRAVLNPFLARNPASGVSSAPTNTAPKPATTAATGGSLTLGSSGTAVVELQQKLTELGYFNDTPTGYYGPITRSAVAAFQAANGLEQVGSVGPQTRSLLSTIATRIIERIVERVSSDAKRPPTLSFRADKRQAPAGETVRLTWTGRNVDTCTAENGWSGQKNERGSESLTLNADTTYALVCTGPGGSVSRSVSVKVAARVEEPVPEPKAPTLTFSTNATSVRDGGSAKLTWKASDASSCVATGGWSGDRSTSGTHTLSRISSSNSYTLTCVGAGGSIEKSVAIALDAPAAATTVSLSVDKTSVVPGSSATLTWSSTNASSCTATNGWTGTKATSGSQSTGALSATKTFTLSCTGASGSASQSVTVTATTAQQPTSPIPTPLPGPAKSYEVYPGCEAPGKSYARVIYIDPKGGTDTGDGSANNRLKTLQAAFSAKKIKSGDHVILMPGDHGTYTGDTKYNQNGQFTTANWTWLDFQEGATINSVELRNFNRILVTNPEVTPGRLYFTGGSQIVVADGDFYGARDASRWSAQDWLDKAGGGMSSRNTRCVSMIDNKFRNVAFGIGIASDGLPTTDNSVKALVARNDIFGFRGDGIRPNGSDITVKNNRIVESMLGSGDGDGNHDDGIQIFALDGHTFRNIRIEDNWIQETTSGTRKLKGSLQGIGHFDGFITDSVVRGNTILVSAWWGIALSGPKNTVIENNTALNTSTEFTRPVRIWANKTKAAWGTTPPQNTIVRNNVSQSFSNAEAGGVLANNIALAETEFGNAFVKFDKVNGIYDLRPKAGGPIAGKGAGANPIGSVPTQPQTPAPVVTLTTDKASVTQGSSAMLTWSSTNATSCTASGSWSGAKSTSGTSSTGALTAGATYTISCTGAGGSASKSVTVSVSAAPVAAPVVTLSVDKASVTSGASATLTWSATNATSCTAANGWTGMKATSGSQSTGALTAAKTFTLSCTGTGGTVSKSVAVAVSAAPKPAPTVTLSLDKTSITSGSSATISWSSSNATSCAASGSWSGAKSTSGSSSTGNLSANQTYTLACTGEGGTTSKSVSVSVSTQPTTPAAGNLSGSYPVYPGCEAPSKTYLRNVYIDPAKGSDAGDGSIEKPYKTLGAVLAAKKLQAGDHAVLLPGDHGKIYANGKFGWPMFLNASQWTWIEFRSGAKVDSFDLRDISRLIVTNAEVTSTSGAQNLALMSGGNHIIFADSEFYGAKSSSNWGINEWLAAPHGLTYRNTVCGALLRSDITNVRFGMNASTDGIAVSENRVNVLMQGNTVKNFSGDGARPNASNVTMRDNRILDSYAGSAHGDGNHDDGVQMFALNGAVYDNIVIENTWIQETTDQSRPLIGGLQGIGYFGGVLNNLRIANNTILVSAHHGIAVYGAKGAVIENNTVNNPSANGNKTWITVPENKELGTPQNVIVRNNTARHIMGAPSGVTFTNNILVTDPAAAFVEFNPAANRFDLRPKAGGPLDGKGVGSSLTKISSAGSAFGQVAGATTASLEEMIRQLEALLKKLR